MLHAMKEIISIAAMVLIMLAAVLFIGCKIAGVHFFSVASGSMTPAYPVNSLVVVMEADPESIEKGDVITFVADADGTLITHRVVAADPEAQTFTTRGDANDVDDAAPVLWKNTVGKVVFGIPLLGRLFSIVRLNRSGKIIAGIIAAVLLMSLLLDFAKAQRSGRCADGKDS